jgi:hypothetical protein
MPNFFSAFTSEVFRPIVTLLIPGAIGISTWFIALLWSFPELKGLVSKNHAEAGLVMLLAMIFAGLVLEDFGARWEKQLDNKANELTDQLHRRQWYEYLRTAFRADPTGRGYLRSLVLRLKFELGTAFAMLSAALGCIWLALLGLGWKAVTATELLCIAFVIWALWEACQTHDLLAQTRAELLKGIKIVGD